MELAWLGITAVIACLLGFVAGAVIFRRREREASTRHQDAMVRFTGQAREVSITASHLRCLSSQNLLGILKIASGIGIQQLSTKFGKEPSCSEVDKIGPFAFSSWRVALIAPFST